MLFIFFRLIATLKGICYKKYCYVTRVPTKREKISRSHTGRMTAGDFSKETVGNYLKREREARRISLEEISTATRISRPYLEALERNDFRFFSRPEYIHGFLQGYARSIGLEPNDVLRRYEFQLELARLRENFHQLPLFQTPGSAPGEEQNPPLEPPPLHPPKKKAVSRSIVIQFIILVLALSISLYLYFSLKELGP